MKKRLLLLLFVIYNIATYAQIGINTDKPVGAELDIVAKEKGDPLILDGIKTILDSPNNIDSDTTSYSYLMISDNGVVRKEPTKSVNEAYIMDLAANVESGGGSSSDMTWVSAKGDSSKYITISNNGTYIFALRLYGIAHYEPTWNEAFSQPYDISMYKEDEAGTSSLCEEREINIICVKKPNLTDTENIITDIAFFSYTGKAGDKIFFNIIGKRDEGSSLNLNLELRSNPGLNADKTSMIYWGI